MPHHTYVNPFQTVVPWNKDALRIWNKILYRISFCIAWQKSIVEMHHCNLGSLPVFFMLIYCCVLHDLDNISIESVKSKLNAHPDFHLSVGSSWKHLGDNELLFLLLNWQTIFNFFSENQILRFACTLWNDLKGSKHGGVINFHIILKLVYR